jgi:hypothetical protein
MHAGVGDLLHVHANCVGARDQVGEIVEVRGDEGTPPYLVRFGDGHTRLVFPGPDAVVEPTALSGAFGQDRGARRVHGRAGW